MTNEQVCRAAGSEFRDQCILSCSAGIDCIRNDLTLMVEESLPQHHIAQEEGSRAEDSTARVYSADWQSEFKISTGTFCSFNAHCTFYKRFRDRYVLQRGDDIS